MAALPAWPPLTYKYALVKLGIPTSYQVPIRI